MYGKILKVSSWLYHTRLHLPRGNLIHSNSCTFCQTTGYPFSIHAKHGQRGTPVSTLPDRKNAESYYISLITSCGWPAILWCTPLLTVNTHHESFFSPSFSPYPLSLISSWIYSLRSVVRLTAANYHVWRPVAKWFPSPLQGNGIHV